MSETNTTPAETTSPGSTSVLNLVVESVMDMIDAMSNFALITRGALGSGNGLSCEISPSNPETVFMDKEDYIPVTLTLNGKHFNLQTLSDTLNNIQDTLCRKKSYTSGNGWQIVDITKGILPRIIGREENNAWLMAAEITIKVYRKDEQTE